MGSTDGSSKGGSRERGFASCSRICWYFSTTRALTLYPHLSAIMQQRVLVLLNSSLSAVPAPSSFVVSTVAQAGPFSMILCLVKPLPSFMSSEGLLMLPAATLHRVTGHNQFKEAKLMFSYPHHPHVSRI